MSIAEFSIEWYYWGPVLALLATACWLMRAKPLDFTFMTALIVSQYVVHSVILFGPADEIAIFCILFYALFVLVGQERIPLRVPGLVRSLAVSPQLEESWIRVAKWYLLIYYACRLAFYPFFSGELVLDDRLGAQQDNVAMFILGLGMTPALAAMVYGGLRPGGKFSGFDALVMAVAGLGILGSGSKGGLLPIILSFVGVTSFLGQRLLKYKLAIAVGVAAAAGTLFLLTRFFPDLSLTDIGGLMLYRIAASTDNLEYLDAIGMRPADFPYSGLGALFPMIARRFGYVYEYSPGVWLHGSRFGNWEGFGPNSGIVLDYFGNLGWGGLLAAIALGGHSSSSSSSSSSSAGLR